MEKNRSKDIKHLSFPCVEVVERLATSANISSKLRLEEMPSKEVEHVETCPTSLAEEITDHQLEEIMKAFATSEQYPDEPAIDLTVWLRRIEAQERGEKEQRKQRKAQALRLAQVHWPLALAGMVLAAGIVLIVNLPVYNNATSNSLVLVQRFLMTLSERKEGVLRDKHKVKHKKMQKRKNPRRKRSLRR